MTHWSPVDETHDLLSRLVVRVGHSHGGICLGDEAEGLGGQGRARAGGAPQRHGLGLVVVQHRAPRGEGKAIGEQWKWRYEGFLSCFKMARENAASVWE